MTQRSDEHDLAFLEAMASLTSDPGERERVLRARLERWRGHALCGPRAALPEAYWGPERLDPAAFAELLELISPDPEASALLRALSGVTDLFDLGAGFGPAARQARLPAELAALACRTAPVGDGGADAAIAVWALQYTDDPIAAIDELERIARRRIAIVQGAPDNDLVAIYNRAADAAGAPRAHHGWLLSHAATRLELAGFKVTLEPVPVPVRTPPGGARQLADLFARLHFAGHPATDAVIPAIGGYIDARIAEAGALSDDAVLLVARR
jgi:hypothetical protein